MTERFRRAPAPLLLLADPDAGFCAMARDALRESADDARLWVAGTGADLMARLAGPLPEPAILLAASDLPGPPAGLEVVRAVKSNAAIRCMPVVVLGPDARPETVVAAYDAGANSYIAKPATFLALVRTMKTFTAYWLGAAQLPRAGVA
jgi:two-component system response regulator